jgi:predicted nucleotidyltransferase
VGFLSVARRPEAKVGALPAPLAPAFKGFLVRIRSALRPERVILFGSRARGDHRSDDGFDLLVVSRKFDGVRWVERPAMVLAFWDLPFDLEALCLTPAEFKKGSHELSIIGVATSEGLALV